VLAISRSGNSCSFTEQLRHDQRPRYGERRSHCDVDASFRVDFISSEGHHRCIEGLKVPDLDWGKVELSVGAGVATRLPNLKSFDHFVVETGREVDVEEEQDEELE